MTGPAVVPTPGESPRGRLWAALELLLAAALVVGANVYDFVPVTETPWLVLLYLAGGRNLWLPILAHGFSDTIAMVLIDLGLVPELRG